MNRLNNQLQMDYNYSTITYNTAMVETIINCGTTKAIPEPFR